MALHLHQMKVDGKPTLNGRTGKPLDLKEIQTFLKPDDLEAELDKLLVLVVFRNHF
jgi:hypothetical protein